MFQNIKHLLLRVFEERNDVLSFFFTSTVSLATSFFLLFILANFIEKNELGTYQYIIALASTIGSISLTGSSVAIMRAAGKGQWPSVKKVFGLSAKLTLIPTFIGFAVGIYYFLSGNKTLAFGIFFGAIAHTWLSHQLRFNSVLLAKQNFISANMILSGKAIAPLLVIIPFIFIFSITNPAVLAISYFFSSLIVIVFMFYVLGGYKIVNLSINQKPTHNLEITENYNKTAIHQSILTLINVISAHIDKIIVFQLLGAPATALYYVALTIPDKIRELIKQIEPYLFSKFVNHNAESSFNSVFGKFWFMIMASAAVYVGYLVLAPFIFKYLLPQYAEIVLPSMIYGISILASSAIVPYSALKAHGSNRMFYIYTIFQGANKIVLLSMGSVIWGMPGAIVGVACASLINTFTLFGITYYLRIRHTASML